MKFKGMTGFGTLGWVTRWGLSHIGWYWSYFPAILRFSAVMWGHIPTRAGILQSSVQNSQSFQQFAPGVAVSFQLHPIQLSRRKWKLNLVVTQSQRNPGKGRTGEQSLWWDWDHYQSQCCRIPALPLHNLLNFKITAENWRIPQPQSFAESPESRVGLHLPWLCQVVFQAVGSTTCRTPHKIPFMWPFQVKTPHCQLIQQVKLEAAFWLHLKFLPSCF